MVDISRPSLFIYQKWLMWRRHQAQENRDKPQSKFHQSHSPAQTRLFRTTPPLWNLNTAGYPKFIALCLCNKLTPNLDGSPWLNGGRPVTPSSTDFCLAIFVSSPYKGLAFFVTYPGRTSRGLPVPLGISEPKTNWSRLIIGNLR